MHGYLLPITRYSLAAASSLLPKMGFGGSRGERISECKKSVPVAAPIDVVKGFTRTHVEQSPTVHVNAGRPYGELIWLIAFRYACRSSTGSSRGANRCRNVDGQTERAISFILGWLRTCDRVNRRISSGMGAALYSFIPNSPQGGSYYDHPHSILRT